MKRAYQKSLMIAALLILAACGGGDPETPPPQPVSEEGKKQMEELQKLAQNASQTCCSSAAPYMVAVGYALQSPNPQMSMPQQQPNMSACQQAIQNFEMLFRTVDNGQYAQRGDAQQWREVQGKGVINCVGSQMQAAGLPVNPSNVGQYFAAAQGLTQSLQGAVPTLAGAAANAGSRFLSPTSSLGRGLGVGGPGTGSGVIAYGSGSLLNPTSGLGSNPAGYGLLGNNPAGSSSATPTLATPNGAANFLNPNAASQIFVTLPAIPQGGGYY